MSTATIEELNLEGLLEGTPPCQARADGLPCGRPSVTRVTVNCWYCGKATVFLCERCLSWLRTSRASCLHCNRAVLAWNYA